MTTTTQKQMRIIDRAGGVTYYYDGNRRSILRDYAGLGVDETLQRVLDAIDSGAPLNSEDLTYLDIRVEEDAPAADSRDHCEAGGASMNARNIDRQPGWVRFIWKVAIPLAVALGLVATMMLAIVFYTIESRDTHLAADITPISAALITAGTALLSLLAALCFRPRTPHGKA